MITVVNTEFMRARIKAMNIQQNELADEVGTTESMISHILKGKKEPSLRVAKSIAKVLECSLDELTAE